MASNGRRRLPRAAATATLAAALSSSVVAGCGRSTNGSTGGGGEGSPVTAVLPADRPQKPACGLLTQAEVESALGARVSAGKENAQEGRSVCVFTVGPTSEQSVIVVSTASSGVPAAFGAARQRAEAPQSVAAGDEAFVAGNQALVRKGTTMVAILTAVRQPAGQVTSATTKLVQAVASRL